LGEVIDGVIKKMEEELDKAQEMIKEQIEQFENRL